MKQYVWTDLEADRQATDNTLTELIIGGSLTSVEIPARHARTRQQQPTRMSLDSLAERDVYKVGLQTSRRRPFLCSRKGLWPW